MNVVLKLSQLTITCSKSTTETLEKDVNFKHISQLFCVSNVDFEQKILIGIIVDVEQVSSYAISFDKYQVCSFMILRKKWLF